MEEFFIKTLSQGGGTIGAAVILYFVWKIMQKREKGQNGGMTRSEIIAKETGDAILLKIKDENALRILEKQTEILNRIHMTMAVHNKRFEGYLEAFDKHREKTEG